MNRLLKNIYVCYDNGHGAVGLRVEVQGVYPGRSTVRGDGFAGTFFVGDTLRISRGELLFLETKIEDSTGTTTDLVYRIKKDQWPPSLLELRARLLGDVPDAGFGAEPSGAMLIVTTPGKGSVTKSDVFSGTAAAHARVEIQIGPAMWNTTADETGRFTVAAADLSSGPHRAVVTARNEHGDSATTTIEFSLDPSAASLSVTAPTAGSTTATNLFVGTADANAEVTVAADTASFTTVTDGAGYWSLHASGLPDGPIVASIAVKSPTGASASTTVSFTLDTLRAKATRVANRVLAALAHAGTLRCLTESAHFDEKPDSDNPHILVGALLTAMSVSHRASIEQALEEADAGRPSGDLLKTAAILRAAIDRTYGWLKARESSPGYFLRWAQHDHPEIDWGLRSRYEEHNWTAEPSLDEYSGLISGVSFASHLRTCPHEPDGQPFLDRIGRYLRGTHCFLLRPVTNDLTMRGPDIIVNSYPLRHSVGAGLTHPLDVIRRSGVLEEIVASSDDMRNRMALDESFCKFLPTDIRDLGAVARVLTDGSNEIITRIYEHLSESTRTALAEVATTGASGEGLAAMLTSELNEMIDATGDAIAELFGPLSAHFGTVTDPRTRRWLVRVLVFDHFVFKRGDDFGDIVWEHLASQYARQITPLENIIEKWKQATSALKTAEWVLAIGVELVAATVLGPVGLAGIPVLLGAMSYLEGQIEGALEKLDAARIWISIGTALGSEAAVAAGHYNIPIFDRYSIAASWAGDAKIQEAFQKRATRRVDADGDDAWPIHGMACRVWFGALGSIDNILRAMLDRLEDVPKDVHVPPEASIKTMDGFVAAWAMICLALDLDPRIRWQDVLGNDAPAVGQYRRVASRTTCCVSRYEYDGNRFWIHQKNGRVLSSHDVPEQEYDGLVHAKSFDSYFEERIRDQYPCFDVTDVEEVRMMPVISSWIGAIGYDHDTAVLTVELRSGKRHSYSPIPADVYEAFMAAGSKGAFFNERIAKEYD